LKTILLTCGEASGDYHASMLVSQLKKLGSYRVIALGGDKLKEAGAEVLYPMDKYAFMGFAEVLLGLPKILSLERNIKSLLSSGEVDLFLPVDYPGMNLRLSRYAHKNGVPVLYYISPQVWAWGKSRVNRMKGNIDLMAVILPFEEEIYREADIPVEFVGHPMLDEIPDPGKPLEPPEKEEEIEILLFPGSRKQELDRMLPVLLTSAAKIHQLLPRAIFKIGLAYSMKGREVQIPAQLKEVTEITYRGTERLGKSDFVIAASGTVTLQVAISGTPMIVIYKTSTLSYLVGKLLVRIPLIAMPNVLAGRRIVSEFIQGKTEPERIAKEAVDILKDSHRYVRISSDLLKLRNLLGGKGGAKRIAEKVVEMTDS
jgi:lipid-A-disaccharide synthase